MVILLLALLSGAVVLSLISARMTLRAGDERQTRLALRAAALDSSWEAMRNGIKAGTAASECQIFETQSPSGILSRTTLQGLPRDALPPPLQRQDVPVFGQFFSVTTRSSSGAKSFLSRGLACRLPSGTIRILAWVEAS